MNQVKILKINLNNDKVSVPDTFMLENYAVKVVIDFTDCGVDNKTKYVDLRNAANEEFRYELGTDNVHEFYLTNDLTHTKGVLLINPIVSQVIEIGGVSRTQLISFKTYKFNIQETVSAYPGEAGNAGIYDDVILPIKKDVIDLQTLIANHEMRIDILENISGGGSGDNPGLALMLAAMKDRITTNEVDIAGLVIDLADAQDVIDQHGLRISTQEGEFSDMQGSLGLLTFDMDGLLIRQGSVETKVETVERDLENIELTPGPPGIPGPPGHDGQDGYPTYTWIKFADTPTSGLSSSPLNKDYVGYAFNRLLREPPADEDDLYTNYKWQLVKGDDGVSGVPGPPGADGRPSFTWVKYADDKIGTGMVDEPDGKRYIGFAYDKDTGDESPNHLDYQWSLSPGFIDDTLTDLVTTTTSYGTRIEATEQNIGIVAGKVTTIETVTQDPVTGLAATHTKSVENEGAISTANDRINIVVAEVINEDGVGQVSLNKAAIDVQKGRIDLRVTAGEMESYITTTLDEIVLSSDNITLEGYTTINGFVKFGLDGSLTAKDAKFTNATITGNLNAGTLGNLTVDSTGIAFPVSSLRINSATSSIDYGNLKAKHKSIDAPIGLFRKLDIAEYTSSASGLTGKKLTYGIATVGSFMQVDSVLPADTSRGLTLGSPESNVHLPMYTLIGGNEIIKSESIVMAGDERWEVTKFWDGRMIQAGKVLYANQADTAWGNVYYGNYVSYSFPISFKGTSAPHVTVSYSPEGGGGHGWATCSTPNSKTSAGTYYVVRPTSGEVVGHMHIIATGRWY